LLETDPFDLTGSFDNEGDGEDVRTIVGITKIVNNP